MIKKGHGMRRPLFAGCLCLVFIAALRLFGGADSPNIPKRGQVTLTGRVYQKDSEKFYLDSIIIQEQAANRQQENSSQNIHISENIICQWENSASLRLGSTVTVQGSFKEYAQAANPGEFDSREYYQSMHIGGRLTEVRLLEDGKDYSAVKELLYRLRSYWQERLRHIFPSKEAQIMGAMLLGNKEALDSEVKDLYKRNGIIHILSISGLHITVIGMGIYRLLRRIGLPALASAVSGGIILILYGMMTGMSISAYRAIGMYLLHMLAIVCGRSFDLLTALGVIAAVMSVRTPEYLQHAGFLLSFASVLGIGVLYPALFIEKERKPGLRYRSRWRQAALSAGGRLLKELKRSIMAGLAITVTTLPVQLWFYYEIPVYAPLLNLLVLPFMSILLVFGLSAMLIPGLGVLGMMDCVILTCFEKLCGMFGELPLHTWNPGRPKLWQIAVYYCLWLGAVWIAKAGAKKAGGQETKDGGKSRGRGSAKRSILQWMMLAVAVVVLAARPSPESKVTFLDVGQGDCVCVQTSSGEVYLFDCGSSSRKEVGRHVLLPFLKYNGIKEIDGVFVSHGDKDHISGVEELLVFAEEEGIHIKRLLLPDIGSAWEDNQFAGLLPAAGQATKICYIKAGDCREDEGAFIRCLHPPQGYIGEGNAASECFYLELWNSGDKKNKLSLLLTGDVEKEGELMLTEELKKYGIGEITLLKVAHHGSRNATSKNFLRQVNATVSVISCGRDNGYGHPHEELMERLCSRSYVLQTSREGAVTVTLRKGQAYASGYLW